MTERGRRSAVAGGLAVVLMALLTGCARGGGQAPTRSPAAAPPPGVTAAIVALRRDEVLRRVQVSITNRGSRPLHIQNVSLSVPGFASAAGVRKDSPVPPGLTVNLPVAYGEPRCGSGRQAGRAVALLRMRVGADAAREVRMVAADPQGVMRRIAERECLARRLAKEVALTFGRTWRVEPSTAGATLHGTVEVRLNDPRLRREVTAVGGTVIFDLRAERPAQPLARLGPGVLRTSIPVVVRTARCDGHARAETKKPYAFLAWVRDPAAANSQEQPVVIGVSDLAKQRLQRVCPL